MVKTRKHTNSAFLKEKEMSSAIREALEIAEREDGTEAIYKELCWNIENLHVGDVVELGDIWDFYCELEGPKTFLDRAEAWFGRRSSYQLTHHYGAEGNLYLSFNFSVFPDFSEDALDKVRVDEIFIERY